MVDEVSGGEAKLATRAASTISEAMQPKTPKAMYLLRGKRSTKSMAIALRPRAKVSQAAGYKSCLVGLYPRAEYSDGP